MRIASFMAVLAVSVLAGCGGAGLGAKALEATGLRKPPEVSEAHKPPRSVALRLHASNKLNVDKRGQPLALAVRLYKLRQKDAFEAAPYSAFLNPQLERESLGADLIDVREIMLVPGQRYEVTEKLSREAGHVAMVALFQRPADGRWRTTMTAVDAERDGLTVGLHACAITVAGSSQTSTLTSVRCQ